MASVQFKLASAGVLLALLAVTTMMVINEEPNYGGGVLLSEEDGDENALFDALTGVDQAPVTALFRVQEGSVLDIQAPPPPVPPASAPIISSAAAKPPNNSEGQPAVCVERAADVCTNHPPKCKKHGPSCSYEKTCILRSPSCKKTGICTKPGKRCHSSFSEDCVSCAQKTDSCHKAQQIAKHCVPRCRKGCQKDADCEQKCASGCLDRYHSGMRRCKTLCSACHKGSTKVCWDGCGGWKSCAKRTRKPECTIKDECVKKADSCVFDKTCKKWELSCKMVDKCTLTKQVCKDTTICAQKANECTTEYTPKCSSCRATKNGCQGLDAIKKKCNGNCTSSCAGSSDKASCLKKCSQACDTQSASLVQLCQEQCPMCNKKQGPCKFKCLKRTKSNSCTDVCQETRKVKDCRKVCKKKEDDKSSKHCTKQCVKWSPRKVCKHPCEEWKQSDERPCHYPCTHNAFQRTCDEGEATCVQWSAAVRSCSRGTCLKYADPPLAPKPAAEKAEPTDDQVSKKPEKTAEKVEKGKATPKVEPAKTTAQKVEKGKATPKVEPAKTTAHPSPPHEEEGPPAVPPAVGTLEKKALLANAFEIAALKAALRREKRKEANGNPAHDTAYASTSGHAVHEAAYGSSRSSSYSSTPPSKVRAVEFTALGSTPLIHSHYTNNIQATIDKTSSFIDAILGAPHEEPAPVQPVAPGVQPAHLVESDESVHETVHADTGVHAKLTKHDRAWAEAEAEREVQEAVNPRLASSFKAKASERAEKITKKITAKAKRLLRKEGGQAALASLDPPMSSKPHAPHKVQPVKAASTKTESAKAESDLAASQFELKRAMSALSAKQT